MANVLSQIKTVTWIEKLSNREYGKGYTVRNSNTQIQKTMPLPAVGMCVPGLKSANFFTYKYKLFVI